MISYLQTTLVGLFVLAVISAGFLQPVHRRMREDERTKHTVFAAAART